MFLSFLIELHGKSFSILSAESDFGATSENILLKSQGKRHIPVSF